MDAACTFCAGVGQLYELGFGVWFCSVCGYTGGPDKREAPVLPGFTPHVLTAEEIAEYRHTREPQPVTHRAQTRRERYGPSPRMTPDVINSIGEKVQRSHFSIPEHSIVRSDLYREFFDEAALISNICALEPNDFFTASPSKSR